MSNVEGIIKASGHSEKEMRRTSGNNPQVKGSWDQIWEAADRIASYLSVLLAIDYDIDAIDRIAKARKPDDLMEGIYNALRRRDNLEDKVNKALKALENTSGDKAQALSDALRMLRGLNPSHLEVIKRLEGRDVKLVASYIGSKALAHTRTIGILREMFRSR